MYCTVKAALNMMGLPGGYPRPPLQPLPEPHVSRLREGMRKFGFTLVEAAAE
jgi:dihydrodipicolinate synthase/N-acetylneuraminate lyase